MAGQVVVASVMDAFQLLPTHWKKVFNIVRVLGVVSQLARAVLVPAQTVHLDAELLKVLPAPVFPDIEPLHVAARFNEKLHFHLLKLAGAENEVFGDDFVAEGFAHLGDAEGDLHPVGLDDILVVDIDALSRFRP